MALLLDTHIWLWGLLAPDRLAPKVRQALTAQDGVLWLSPVSLWETLILAERGRVALEPDPSSWLRTAMRMMPVAEASLNFEVAQASRGIALEHQDPADRFIAASAKVYGLKLVTADARLLQGRDIEVLPNR